MKRIKLIPHSLRPREKLLKSGAEALTLEELLAVVLVTGTRSMPLSKLVSVIARITKKAHFTKEDLLNTGIGPCKTAQLLAAQEWMHRVVDKPATVLLTAEQVVAHAHEIIHQQKESLLCFYLNARGELLKKETVAVGSLNTVNLVPREIFSLIKELPVASVILVHNHPSGILEPSKEDIHFTQRVKLAADILGVKLLDHLIVSETGWAKIAI